jgi:hypothetical protein
LAESAVGAGVFFEGEGFFGRVKEAIGGYFKPQAVFIDKLFRSIVLFQNPISP